MHHNDVSKDSEQGQRSAESHQKLLNKASKCNTAALHDTMIQEKRKRHIWENDEMDQGTSKCNARACLPKPDLDKRETTLLSICSSIKTWRRRNGAPWVTPNHPSILTPKDDRRIKTQRSSRKFIGYDASPSDCGVGGHRAAGGRSRIIPDVPYAIMLDHAFGAWNIHTTDNEFGASEKR
ncbi:hypothetical protein BDM02DRAFT_3127459 [Thelephora ganbajun]|uniref:Uncharacterized protein n=1 Tax=Thelephora ganbajun TaxID=370292 RepID=A0ACB6ZMA2_THEGA|nr:hypothetical protein BDM02DRAFT_3127459 [Thelephora ganbajun]